MDVVLKIKCGRCGGTGTDENVRDQNGNVVPQSCTSCGGIGYVELGLMDMTVVIEDLAICKRRLRKILDKLEIED